MKTVVVNLWGGPGTGKSTMAHGLMFCLKHAGIDCEYASEYAKDLIFDLENPIIYFTEKQFDMFIQQVRRIGRYDGKTSVIITDSPIALFLHYDKQAKKSTLSNYLETFNAFNNLNYFLERNHSYNKNGRYQQEDEALKVHEDIKGVLLSNGIPFKQIKTNSEFELSVEQLQRTSEEIIEYLSLQK